MITVFARISQVLASFQKEGFTTKIKGKHLRRFVVGLTMNSNPNIFTLVNQTNRFGKLFDNITVGGWLDTETNIRYIDIGTTTNDIDQAKKLGKQYGQIAIWDNLEKKEIRL